MTTEQSFFLVRFFPEDGEVQSFKFPGTLTQVKVETQLFGKKNFPENTKIQIHQSSGELIAAKYLDADGWQENNKARNLITTIGEVLYGATWQSNLARDLNVNIRTVQRWATGETNLPKAVLGDIIAVATSRKKTIENTIDFLQKMDVSMISNSQVNLLRACLENHG